MQIRIDIPKDEQSIKIFVEEFGRGSRNITIPISDNKLEINVGNFYFVKFFCKFYKVSPKEWRV